MKAKMQFGLVALCAILTLFAGNRVAQAGGGSDIAVIQSQDLARDLGLRLNHRGSIYYSAASIDWSYPDTRTSVSVTGKFAEDVFVQLAAFQYNIRLKNPDDTITVWAYGRDDNGTTLFSGVAQFKVGEKPRIQMWQSQVPILNNVKSAEVIPLKDDGTSGQPIPLDVSAQGQVLWQPWLCGAPNGLLAVVSNDGTLNTYRLSSPIGSTPAPNEGMTDIGVQGHYVFVGQDSPVIDIIAVQEKPTVYFVTGKGDSTATFNVRGVVQLPDGSTLIERPSAMELTDQWGNLPFQYKLSTTGPSEIRLLSGEYRVRSFAWNLFGQPNTLYAGPRYEKGAATTPVVSGGGGGTASAAPEEQ